MATEGKLVGKPVGKSIKVGRQEVGVSGEVYTAYRREAERIKKKNQRLRKDGIAYKKKSLDEMYRRGEFEASVAEDVADTVVRKLLVEQLWQAVRDNLSETDALIIIGYYRDKLTEEELAAIVGIARQNIGKRRKKAERLLKNILENFQNIF